MRRADGTVLVAGELDIATAAVLRGAVADVGVRTVDLSGITFVDIAGLRALFDAEVVVRAPSGPVRRLLALCRQAGVELPPPFPPRER